MRQKGQDMISSIYFQPSQASAHSVRWACKQSSTGFNGRLGVVCWVKIVIVFIIVLLISSSSSSLRRKSYFLAFPDKAPGILLVNRGFVEETETPLDGSAPAVDTQGSSADQADFSSA